MQNRSAIIQAFGQYTILVDIQQLRPCDFEESITNQFFKIQCSVGQEYLLRLNGKLWPPFTREAEDSNLNQLKLYGISTSVIHNDYKEGFQICYSQAKSCQFDSLPDASKSTMLIAKIGYSINQFHRIKNFHNTYSIPDTINSGFARVKCDSHQDLLGQFYDTVMGILATFQQDDNLVSSHNDLLPSSVYCNHFNNVKFVDWEYSSMNHHSYDLALFSVKAGLTPQQEEVMLTGYDNHSNNTFYNVTLMKVVVDFLLLQWHVTSKQPSQSSTDRLTRILCNDLSKAEQVHSFYIKSSNGLTRFFKSEHQKRDQEDKRQQTPVYLKASL